MSSPQDRDQLREQFQHLEDDWNSYKKSLPRLPCRGFSLCPSSSLPTTPTTTTSTYVAKSNYFDIIHDSPKKLVSSLQHPTTLRPPSTSPSPVSSAEAEKKAKRPPAYSGRLLLDELERAKDDSDDDDEGDDENKVSTGLLCSGGSSTVIHGASEDDSPTTDDDGCYCSSCVGECDGCYCYCPSSMVLRRVGSRRQQIERFDSSSSSCSSEDEGVEGGDSSSSSSSSEDEGVEGGDSSSSSSSSEDEGVEGGDGFITTLVKLTGLCFSSVFVLLLPLGFVVLSWIFGFQERRVPPT